MADLSLPAIWQATPVFRNSLWMPRRAVRPGGGTRKHAHRFFEIGFVVEGAGTWYFAGNREVPVDHGSAILIPPGSLHSEEMRGKEPARFAWLGFTFEEPVRIPSWIEREIRLGDAMEELLAILRRIRSELRNARLGHPQRIEAGLRDVLVLLARATEPQPRPARPQSGLNARQREVAETSAHFLAEHLHAGLRISDVARHFGWSTPHFSEVFRIYHGVSPQRFLGDLRIRSASDLLCEGRLMVKEVARECGFSDPAQFTRVFRRATGRSPRQFAAAWRSKRAPS